MGKIFDQVFLSHLNKFDSERDILTPFLVNFDVTYAHRWSAKNTQVSIYFLKPEKAIEEQFGLESELLLAVCDYAQMQPRTLQSIEEFINDGPVRGRVDKTTYFLVTKNENGKDWVEDYSALNSVERIPIVISLNQIKKSSNDSWFIRNIMTKQLFSRDLFSEQLPLESDTFFFGRDKIVAEFLDSINQSKNRGLFGLRKTGKTSVLFKLMRMAEKQSVVTLYYDCKDPAIRSLGWEDFLKKIVNDIAKKTGRMGSMPSLKDIHVSEQLRSILRSLTGKSRVAIIFDEVEYISPVAKLDPHWRQDFVPFWQSLWTSQSQFRKISYIIAGVNPSIVELDIVDEVQNPMFGIVTPNYLTGLSDVETRSMLHQLGKRMGLKFEFEAMMYVFDKFGGHPLLTRMAGSYINSALDSEGKKKPFLITRDFLKEGQDSIEQEIAFYCRHITSELKIFYPDEYELLEMLASGNEADFIEFAREDQMVNHLKQYGLIDTQIGSMPKFKIPVLEKYINMERMKKARGQYEFQIVPLERRDSWLKNRVARIIQDCRTLNKKGHELGLPQLYGENGFPESEKFYIIKISENQGQFIDFINTCNRCFVEPIEQIGKRTQAKNYFFDTVKNNFENYWDSLFRVKLYRNNEMHIDLYKNVDADLKSMLDRDLKGKQLNKIIDPYFVLQQMVLDGLFVGLQLDIDRLS